MSADESEFHFCRKWVIIWALTKVKSRFVFVSVHVRDRANENDRRNSLSFSFLSARKYPPYERGRLYISIRFQDAQFTSSTIMLGASRASAKKAQQQQASNELLDDDERIPRRRSSFTLPARTGRGKNNRIGM